MSSESTDVTTSAAPAGEAAVLVGVQSVLTNPTTVAVSRGLSHFGEHSLGWLALAGAGAALAARTGNETARRRYIEAGVGAFGHLGRADHGRQGGGRVRGHREDDRGQ